MKHFVLLVALVDFSFVGNKVVCHYDDGSSHEVYVDVRDKNSVDAVYKECEDKASKKGE